jgi:hypothetical protein
VIVNPKVGDYVRPTPTFVRVTEKYRDMDYSSCNEKFCRMGGRVVGVKPLDWTYRMDGGPWLLDVELPTGEVFKCHNDEVMLDVVVGLISAVEKVKYGDVEQ